GMIAFSRFGSFISPSPPAQCESTPRSSRTVRTPSGRFGARKAPSGLRTGIGTVYGGTNLSAIGAYGSPLTRSNSLCPGAQRTNETDRDGNDEVVQDRHQSDRNQAGHSPQDGQRGD